MHKKICGMVGLAMALVTGCTGPRWVSPEASRYRNARLAFSADIPAGWERREASPEYVRSEMRIKLPPDFEGILLADQATAGEIWVFGSLVNINWNAPSNAPNCRIQECVSALIDEMRNKLTPAPQNFNRHDDRIEMTRRNWQQTKSDFKPASLASIDFGAKSTSNQARSHLELMIYPCFNNQTCILMIIGRSPHGHLDENQAAFRAFVSSIRAHDE